MLLEIEKEESFFNGLWLLEKSYQLGSEAFSDEMKKSVLKQTSLKYQFPDWWVSAKGAQPQYSWKQLIELSLKILNSDATRTYVSSMWLENMPEVTIQDIEPVELPIHLVSGSKKINATSQIWKNSEVSVSSKFILQGKDDSCPVEGTWLHWVFFACNILSCENTRKCCPELFCRELVVLL